MAFWGGSFIEIRYCWLQPESLQAFVYDNNATNTSAVYIHHCHIARAGRGVIYGETGTILDDFRFFHNVWEGPGNLSTGAYHLDGLMIGDPATNSITLHSAPTVRNIQFYSNLFMGDWGQQATALYYSNGGTYNTRIFNNVFAYENTTGTSPYLSPGFLVFGKYDGGSIEITNNTFSNDAHPGYGNGVSLAILIGTPRSGTLIVKNNIFSNIGNNVVFDDGLNGYLH